MTRILIFLAILIFLSCAQSIERNKSHIEIHYLPPNMSYPMRLDCSWFQSELFNDRRKKVTIMDDDKFMTQFTHLYKKLSKTNREGKVDTRIQIFYHNNNKIDTICMGQYFDISVNGELKEDSPELLTLIRSRIYK